jgi:hypothetical protein
MVQDTELTTRASEADGSGPHFLGDQPCTDPDRIRFGHEVYVTALQNAVGACPTPFVIGLYGKWGTGKTTVLEGLRTALQKGPSRGRDFRVCLFDSWKYSEETSFRRQFLVELNKQLSLGWDLDSLLYRPKEEQKVDVSALRRNLRTGFCTAAAVTLGLVLAYLALRLLIGAQLASVLIAAAAGGILTIVMFLVGIVFDLIKMSTYRVTQPLIFAPEQFEEQFREMLRKAKITDDRRLVVLVDNLDRCPADAAVSALKTIKTFLEHEGCIFLVACDEHALIRHLTRERGDSDDRAADNEAKEFLRKFFQTTIEVQPLDDDLRDFASDLVDEAGLQPEVANVLWAASPTDPRRILQFLNRLTLALHVVKAREASGRLEPGVVSANQAFLAKVLWVNELCAEFVEACVNHPELLELADQAINYPETMVSDHPMWNKYLSPAVRQPDGEYRELYRFLEATLPIRDKDPRPFLVLQMPGLDMSIDDPGAFRQALREGRARDIASLISGVTDPLKLQGCKEIITRMIEQQLDLGRDVDAFQACRVAVQCFIPLPRPRGALANAVCRVLRSVNPENDIPAFDQRSLVNCIVEASPPLRSPAIEVVLKSLDHKSPHTADLINALQEHSDLLDPSEWRGVGNFLRSTLSGAPDTAFQYLTAIDPDSQSAAGLFDGRTDILTELCAMVARPEVALADAALQAFARFRQHADSAAMDRLATSIVGLLSSPLESRVEGYLARATTALGYLDLDKTSGELISLLHNAIRAAIGEPRPAEEIAQLVPHLLRLYGLESEPQQQETLGLITGFAHSWPPDKLTLLGDTIWHAQIEPLKEALTNAVGERASDQGRASEEIQSVLAAVASISLDTECSALSTAIARMLDSPEVPRKELGASQLAVYADRLSRARLDELVGAVHREYTARPAAESAGLLVHLLELIDTQRGKSIRNTLADRLKTEMSASDPSVRRAAAQSYRVLRERAKLSQSTRKNAAQDLADALYGLRKELGTEDAILFEVLLEEQGNQQVLHSTWHSLADTIESLLHSEHPPQVRRMACQLIRRFHKLPKGATEGILEQLELFAGDDSLDQDIKDDASSAIASVSKPQE